MSSIRNLNIQSTDEEILRLKSDLYMARCTIIQLMPDEIGELLRGYYSCESREKGARWMDKVIETLIERADSPDLPENAWNERRAICPLCGEGSSSPYVQGYSLPEGLRRHLIGWGNTRQCDVMKTVYLLACDYWRENFAASEQEARQAEQTTKANRRKIETLYRTSPDSDPKLLDEGSYSWRHSRTLEQLVWAEVRLRSLGFHCMTEGNTVCWVDERDDYVVYADHRLAGRIDFEIWRKPLPKRLKTGSRLGHRPHRFHLLDSWKNDLSSKYTQRVTQGLAG